MCLQIEMLNESDNGADALLGATNHTVGNAGIRRRNQKLILQAASEAFATTGFTATHSHDIAERAGVPKANLYYYFQSKENLYVQVLTSFVDPLVRASAALRKSDDPIVGLRAYIKARIRIIREHPFSAAVFSQELLSGASICQRHARTCCTRKPSATSPACATGSTMAGWRPVILST